MNLSKILKFVSLILFFIILGEVGYYAYKINMKRKTLGNNLSTTQINSGISAEIDYCINEIKEKIQINDSYLNDFKTFLIHQKDIKDGVLSSSVLIDKYQGIIMEIENKKEAVTSGIDTLHYSIKIKNKNLKEVSLFFTNSFIARTKIIAPNMPIDKKLIINDLKIGDEIEVTYVFDLLKPVTNNINEVIIVKK